MDKVERWLPARRSGFVLTWIWVSAMLTGLCSLEPFTSENATSLKQPPGPDVERSGSRFWRAGGQPSSRLRVLLFVAVRSERRDR
jgi:hypothetical protein